MKKFVKHTKANGVNSGLAGSMFSSECEINSGIDPMHTCNWSSSTQFDWSDGKFTEKVIKLFDKSKGYSYWFIL